MPSFWLSDTQKIGVVFCAGGAFFLLGGVMMFFDRAMLSMGNILLLIGLPILLGPRRVLSYFTQRSSLPATACFFAGILIVLILRRLAFLGFGLEIYGLLALFGDFLASVAGFVGAVPVVGPWVAAGLRWVGRRTGGGEGGRKNVELPV